MRIRTYGLIFHLTIAIFIMTSWFVLPLNIATGITTGGFILILICLIVMVLNDD